MPDRRLPREIEPYAEALFRAIGPAWVKAVEAITAAWQLLHRKGRLNVVSAQNAVRETLRDWPALTARRFDLLLDRIYLTGFTYGIADTGVQVSPDVGDANVLEWLKTNPNGFMPALRHLTQDGVRSLERVVEEAYRGYDENGEPAAFDLPQMVTRAVQTADVGVVRARLIIRTETAKATAYGRIMAWGDDPDKALFDYHWIAAHDDRVKDVSLKFEAEGPYEYAQIKRLWEVDHNAPQWVRNRKTGKMEWQTSAFNCRCGVARTPKTAAKLFAEGTITRAQYEAELAHGGQVEWRPNAA